VAPPSKSTTASPSNRKAAKKSSKTTKRTSKRAAPGTNGQVQNTDSRPLGGFAALVGIYGAGVAAAAVIARKKRIPDRFTPWDLLLLGIATHKLSRRISKDSVTSPLRAPFAEFREPAGSGEVNEEVEGSGFQKAVGELITCPFCVGQWVATGLVFGLAFAPRATRMLAGVFASAAVADFLQLAYARAEQAAGEG
jgi:hypothetical protein